ncbi:MAG: pyridoxamine 5'-phosphate oxidase family protein [Pirellulaceae bacterium]|nr:pyridoxamine 5'-phosphate oxidase family protein [Pirellulaceae bacterium]MDP6720978.1 pyridoxamine 5'-phosphate oxidase family protein [Pirellulaceae bacterium]
MTIERFQKIVTSADELTELLGSPSLSGVKKQLSELDDHMAAFIATSPFLLLGTVGSDGRCDVSPRGDMPDVGKVLDSRTLAIPEWKGNRRVDSLRNVIQTGQVGLLFMTPGLGETLRVNGRACVIRDADVLASMSKEGKQPLVGIAVEVEECFFQCAKALLRSRLWEWSAEHSAPPPFDFAEILVDQTKIEGLEVEPLRQQIEESYKEGLY